MLNAKEIYDFAQAQQARHAARDSRWYDVRNARMGDLSSVAPEMFSEDIPKPIVANFVDTVARDVAEMVAPLPSFSCNSATMQSDTARRFADKRTKIVQNYLTFNKMARQMLEGADHLNTYACTAWYLEPDFEAKMPRATIEDPMGGYADFDRWGRLVTYTKRLYQDAHKLGMQFSEFYDEIAGAPRNGIPGGSNMVEMIRYCDKDQIALVLLGKQPTMLVSVKNRLGEVPVVIAKRAWLHSDEYKGQFDDAVWIQVARDALARLNLEAVEKSVQAPLAVPSDLQEVALGPDALLRTSMPEKVRRVALELPQGAFAESAVLSDELRTGTRYPQARSGNMDASVITGRGVQALMGGFETQIRAAQAVLKDAFADVVRLMFKMDETFWPNAEKEIRGQSNGTPYDVTYKPSRDIKGDHTVSVEYGFASGMDPNRAVVMLLQLRGDKLISRDYMQRQLPFDLNVTEEQSKVAVEDLREALGQGIMGYVQAIPALAQSGMDPSDPILKAAMMVKGIQKGDTIEDVISKVFIPQAPPPQAQAQTEAGLPSAGSPLSGMGETGGLTDSGRMVGVAPGQAGQAPGGRPDLLSMLSGLTGDGKPQMSAYTMRRRRI